MASLPTVGGSLNTWGTELNDYLLVAHNADGTQKNPVGSSYLVATAADLAGLANGVNGNHHFTLVSVVGSSLEIDAGDDTLINILEDGWYIPAYGYAIFNDGADTAIDLGIAFVLNGNDAFPNGTMGCGSATGTEHFMQGVLSYPLLLSSGDSLQVKSSATWTGTSTWSSYGAAGNLRIVRIG